MGPLKGLRVIELEGLGPAPFCGMMLADMGAEVISISRKSAGTDRSTQISERGKRSIAVDLKQPEGIEVVLKLCESADALIEGFRPGVMERLGLGPEPCMGRNPKLVYGRMTGWGQTGPLANAAGHDINYISLSGVLHACGNAGERPTPPINLVGDFGGGAMFLAFGLMCAIWEAGRSGKGQVVDVSMVEGSATLMHMMYSFKAAGTWKDERGVNLLDGGAHFYNTFETADGKYVSIGALEPQFYKLLLDLAGLDKDRFASQEDQAQWQPLREELAAAIKMRTRAEWCALMEGTDACFAPILSMSEAPIHPHNQARGSFMELAGVVQPSPAPKFSRTAPEVQHSPNPPGADTVSVLRSLGYADEDITRMRNQKILP